jgi:hypothetical protein
MEAHHVAHFDSPEEQKTSAGLRLHGKLSRHDAGIPLAAARPVSAPIKAFIEPDTMPLPKAMGRIYPYADARK